MGSQNCGFILERSINNVKSSIAIVLQNCRQEQTARKTSFLCNHFSLIPSPTPFLVCISLHSKTSLYSEYLGVSEAVLAYTGIGGQVSGTEGESVKG